MQRKKNRWILPEISRSAKIIVAYNEVRSKPAYGDNGCVQSSIKEESLLLRLHADMREIDSQATTQDNFTSKAAIEGQSQLLLLLKEHSRVHSNSGPTTSDGRQRVTAV